MSESNNSTAAHRDAVLTKKIEVYKSVAIVIAALGAFLGYVVTLFATTVFFNVSQGSLEYILVGGVYGGASFLLLAKFRNKLNRFQELVETRQSLRDTK